MTVVPASRFATFWGLGLAALLLVTAPLWLSRWPGNESPYPMVPWIDLPLNPTVAFGLDVAFYLGVLVGCLAVCFLRGAVTVRRCWWCIGVMLIGLVIFDQHRLQPWVLQSILYSIILASCRWQDARRLLTAIAISIYFYSSLGKLDFQFVHTVGRQMVQVFLRPLGGIDDAIAVKLAFALPLSELLMAILLSIPATRRVGGFISVGMHLSLIAILGPWSLGHSWGVLVWNAVLAIQAWLLFIGSSQIDPSRASAEEASSAQWIAFAVVGIALAAPLSERFGYWDHWASWSLYSPHTSRAAIEIHRSAIYKLPSGIVPYLMDEIDDDGWLELDLSAWSLGERSVPVYPQARYQIRIGLELATTYDLGKAIRAKRKDVADRWTGMRAETFLLGVNDFRREAETFWLK